MNEEEHVEEINYGNGNTNNPTYIGEIQESMKQRIIKAKGSIICSRYQKKKKLFRLVNLQGMCKDLIKSLITNYIIVN